MALLSRTQIDAAEDLSAEAVDVPEWGGEVKVRRLNAGEHLRLGVQAQSIPPERVMLTVLSLAIAGDDGAPLFPGEEGVDALARKNPDVITRLYEAAARLNRLRAEDVEAAAKN